VSTLTVSYNRREEYQDAPQKIFQGMESFSFYFDGGNIHYRLYFGAMFVDVNSTHKRLVSDVFVVTMNDYFVSSLRAYLNFDVTFTASGIYETYTTERSDNSPFVTTYEVIYEFPIHSFLVHSNQFPVNLHVDFEYTLSSSEFNIAGSLQATETFDWFPYWDLVIGGVVALVVIVIIIIGLIVYIKRRNNQKKMGRYKKKAQLFVQMRAEQYKKPLKPIRNASQLSTEEVQQDSRVSDKEAQGFGTLPPKIPPISELLQKSKTSTHINEFSQLNDQESQMNQSPLDKSEEKPEVTIYTCRNCGFRFPLKINFCPECGMKQIINNQEGN
jgi:rubrerythrin